VRAADGLVFATPEYHRSLPTILKSAIGCEALLQSNQEARCSA
jgi:hypothetical protein